MRRAVVCAGVLALGSCTKDDGDAVTTRATLRRTGGTTVELIPSKGQLSYCLAFTHSAKGVTRQLTMSKNNLSFDCKSGKPVGGRAFRIPVEEGAVKLYVLFSSEPINAASVAQQLLEQSDLREVSVMDLRLPGRVALEVLEFSPEADMNPAEGHVLGTGLVADGGAP